MSMCGVSVNLENERVLLSGVGRGKEFFCYGVISWVGKKGGIPFFSLFFLSHNFPKKIFKEINVIFWWYQTWKNFNTKKIISKFKEKRTKSCLKSNIKYI
jgi:hypothetical protein